VVTVHGNGYGGELLGYAAVLGPQRSRLRRELGGNDARHGSFFTLAHLRAHSRPEQFFTDCARLLAHLRARRARGQRSPARPRLAPRAQPLRVAQLEEEERRVIS